MLSRLIFTIACLALVVMSGCGEAKWKPLAETVILKLEELPPFLGEIQNREDVFENVEKVEAWRNEIYVATWDFYESASRFEIDASELRIYEERFSKTFAGLHSEILRIFAIEGLEADDDYLSACGLYDRAITLGNPFTEKQMSASFSLMEKSPNIFPPESIESMLIKLRQKRHANHFD